jgi:bacteriocin-like protein
MKIGDLVRFLPKEYGTMGNPVPDQWSGLTGMILEVYRHTTAGNAREMSILVTHPDDGFLTEIFAFNTDIQVIDELTDEITDKQLEHVIGGQSHEAFEIWKSRFLNREEG